MCFKQEFMYLGVLFTKDSRTKRKTLELSAVMVTLPQSIGVMKTPSQKTTLLIYWFIYIPTLTYCMVIKYGSLLKERDPIVAKMSFYRRLFLT